MQHRRCVRRFSLFSHSVQPVSANSNKKFINNTDVDGRLTVCHHGCSQCESSPGLLDECTLLQRAIDSLSTLTKPTDLHVGRCRLLQFTFIIVSIIDRISEGGNAIASARLSVRLFPLYLLKRLTVDLELFLVSRP